MPARNSDLFLVLSFDNLPEYKPLTTCAEMNCAERINKKTNTDLIEFDIGSTKNVHLRGSPFRIQHFV